MGLAYSENTAIAVSKKMLDLLAYRQKVLAHNIANVDTPNYKSKDVKFVDILRDAVEKNTLSAIESVEPELVENDNPADIKNDGNSVNIDMEMVKIAENAALYSMQSQLLTINYGKYKNAIAGRTR